MDITKSTGNKEKKLVRIFVHQRILSRKQKDDLLHGRKYLQILHLIMVLNPEYKEVLKLNIERVDSPIKHWAKHMNRHFSKEGI